MNREPKKLTLIIGDAALEIIPRELWKHPSVERSSRRRGKPAKYTLLDKSLHRWAMNVLENQEKRGRPDIVHRMLLQALHTPLNKSGLLQIYVHTIRDQIIEVNSNVRLPTNYNQFVGLMEQLFKIGRVPPKGLKLLEITDKNFIGLIGEIQPKPLIVLSPNGEPKNILDVGKILSEGENPAVIVGGFPHGEFSKQILDEANQIISIYPEPLPASVIVARLIFAYELAINLTK